MLTCCLIKTFNIDSWVGLCGELGYKDSMILQHKKIGDEIRKNQEVVCNF